MRLDRLSKRGSDRTLGSYAGSVAIGIIPGARCEPGTGLPTKGIHIMVEADPDPYRHSLRGTPAEAERLILDLALAIAQARSEKPITSSMLLPVQRKETREAQRSVLMGLVDRLLD